MATLTRARLYIEQGCTWQQRLIYKAGDPLTPVDMTGWTARLHVRTTVESPELLLELTTENGGITLGGTTGEISIDLSAADTAAITWPTGLFDLELVSAGGIVKRVLRGTIAVRRDV
ncbi:MAG: hypothetical protein ACOZJX_05275 [Pseudomonadota bacterium]